MFAYDLAGPLATSWCGPRWTAWRSAGGRLERWGQGRPACVDGGHGKHKQGRHGARAARPRTRPAPARGHVRCAGCHTADACANSAAVVGALLFVAHCAAATTAPRAAIRRARRTCLLVAERSVSARRPRMRCLRDGAARVTARPALLATSPRRPTTDLLPADLIYAPRDWDQPRCAACGVAGRTWPVHRCAAGAAGANRRVHRRGQSSGFAPDFSLASACAFVCRPKAQP